MEQEAKLPRLTSDQKRNLISQWEESGKSKKQFAKENGLNYYTFAGWCYKEKRKKSSQVNSGFSQVRISRSAVPFASIELSPGRRLNFYHSLPMEYFQSLLGK